MLCGYGRRRRAVRAGRRPEQKLNIVYQQDIDAAIGLLKLNRIAIFERFYKIAHKLLRGNVDDFLREIEILRVVSDRLEEVGLTQADRTIDHQGIELRFARRIGHGQCRCMSEAAALANYEIFKCIAFVKRSMLGGSWFGFFEFLTGKIRIPCGQCQLGGSGGRCGARSQQVTS